MSGFGHLWPWALTEELWAISSLPGWVSLFTVKTNRLLVTQ